MSDIHTGQIDQLQQDIVDRLTSCEALMGISVLYEKTHDIASAIEIALGKLGICIVVTPPVCNVEKANLPGPYFDNITIDINVPENVLLNQGASGTHKTSSYVAEIAANRLHRFQTRDCRCLLVQRITPVPDPTFRVYRVPIKTSFGLTAKSSPLMAEETETVKEKQL